MTTSSSSQPLTLDRAKRDLETSVEFVTRYMLQPIDSRLAATRYIDREGTDKKAADAANNLYYFYSTCANRKTFDKHVVAVLTAFPSLRKDDMFGRMLDTAYAAYDLAAKLSAEEKARKAGKRAAVQAKQDLKAELNLQEGVKLQGVDVGQYKAILAGLEPVRSFVLACRRDSLKNLRNKQAILLQGANWNAKAVEAWQVGDKGYRYFEAPAHFNAFFKVGSRETPNWCARPANEVAAYIEKTAEQMALAYVQGYAIKLALKTGETIANDPALAPLAAVLKVLRCTVSSPDLWRNSTATIVLSPDVREFSLQFHTQIIWNRSCLGLQFNQYPTRRVL